MSERIYKASVVAYNFMAMVVQRAAMSSAVVASAVLLVAATRYEVARVALSLGPATVALAGLMVGVARSTVEDRRARLAALEHLLTQVIRGDKVPGEEEVTWLRRAIDELGRREAQRLVSALAPMDGHYRDGGGEGHARDLLIRLLRRS